MRRRCGLPSTTVVSSLQLYRERCSCTHSFWIWNFKTYSTAGVENDTSTRPLNLTSASRDLDLWPPDPQTWYFHSVVSCTSTANLQPNRLIRFQNIMFKRLVANEQTEGRMNKNIIPPPSLDWRRQRNYCWLTVTLRNNHPPSHKMLTPDTVPQE